MFWQIFLFEIKYRLKRPGVYIYFAACFIIAFLVFGFGSLPLADKEHINSPSSFAYYVSMMSLGMMLASSAIMGVPLYRDIEYNTREYYLSYPITKAGYFWGRYLGSFLFVILLAIGLLLGAFFGTLTGPAFGWMDASNYGPNHFSYYLQPFLTLALPNLFFTSSLFFGLVAILRNVKVIYSSGIILFLGYLMGKFFLNSSGSPYLINLSDPFAISSIDSITNNLRVPEKNYQLVSVTGLYLANRILWLGTGLVILAFTWFRFSFEKFFSPAKEKKAIPQSTARVHAVPTVHINFTKKYNRPVLFTLTKIEILNIIRDNYFWIIIIAGSIFLGFIFRLGLSNFGVRDYPTSSMILFFFNNNFLIFIFCVIIFYTGEVIHRERSTRYAFIHDSLPPPVWLLNLAKILSIFCLSIFLTVLPMFMGVIAQVTRGFYQFNFPVYFNVLLFSIFPKLIEMTMLSFLLHILIRNKFAALGIGITYMVLCLLAIQSGYMTYRLLLFSYGPFFAVSDFDNIGHMLKPVSWFNIYWILFGSLLLTIGYLFYIRGTISSFKERIQLAKERFRGKTVLFSGIILIGFIVTAGFNYYNVSYLNHYYTKTEETEHAVMIEKTLKHFEDMPLPKIVEIKMFADLFPEKQVATFKSYVTLVNKTDKGISEVLLDGDNVADYTIEYNGKILSYTNPLLFPGGKFNLFGPKKDSSGYRLYQLSPALRPADTAQFQVNSIRSFDGFTNNLYAAYFLHNGTFMGVGLPGLGYDDDEELRSETDRKKYGLSKREDEFPIDKEAEGANILLSGRAHDLIRFEITISTSADQVAIGPGNLESHWKKNDRNFYKYTCNNPGMYTPAAILSARYAELHDSVLIDDNRYVNIDLYYHPTHNTNLQRFIGVYKDGLKYYSSIFGPYPYKQMRLAECSVYGPGTTWMAATDIFSERFGWNSDFKNSGQFVYCYYTLARQLAQQWWGNEVYPNHTKGSELIINGISRYCGLLLNERKYGANNIRKILEDDMNWYILNTKWDANNQNPLIHAGNWAETGNKAGIALYGLKDLAGEENVNAALREFKDAYAYKNEPPFAGTKELYRYLKKHTPDSVQYYLEDTWQKICFYDNRIIDASSVSLGNNQYKVLIKLSTGKTYLDSTGVEKPADHMNDYIDIGVFGEDKKNKEGGTQPNPIYLQKHKLTAGEHTLEIIVKGKPISVGVDPFLKLIDRNKEDNVKKCELQ